MARKNVKQEFQPSGDISRIIPLGSQKWAYLMDYTGKTLHFKRDTQEFVDACILNDEKMNGKITRDLIKLKWNDVIDRMKAYSTDAV